MLLGIAELQNNNLFDGGEMPCSETMKKLASATVRIDMTFYHPRIMRINVADGKFVVTGC